MGSHSRKFSTLFFASLILFVLCPLTVSAMDLHNAGGNESFFLSAEEAMELRLSESEWSRLPIQTRGISRGPVIDFRTPIVKNSGNPTLEALSPLSLTVFFEEKNAPVDMASLEVVAKKGFFSKSLTDRVTPFVEGTTLQATGLKIPSGKFKIQIIIADLQGNQTSKEYRLIIADM